MKSLITPLLLLSIQCGAGDYSALNTIDQAMAKQYPGVKYFIDSNNAWQDPDAYELDYSEKCDVLDQSNNKELKKACKELNQDD